MGSLESVYQIKTVAVFCKVTANGFTGFWIYFVSMTPLSLQIKSKLIFLTATWVHPVGVCGASCVPQKAGTRNGTAAACWRPERAPKGREQISKYLLDSTWSRGSKSEEADFIFWKEKRQAGSMWPQRQWQKYQGANLDSYIEAPSD